MQRIPVTTTIWSFQRRLTHRLLWWAIPNVLLGTLLVWRGQTPARRAFGQQAVGWGAIDAAIALGGQYGAEQKQATATPAVEVAQARTLRRLLWLNTGLDLLYMAGGLALARGGSDSKRGHGLGIFVQGAFLFVFDLFHALQTPKLQAPPLPPAPPLRREQP
jgi:hypothetical protein